MSEFYKKQILHCVQDDISRKKNQTGDKRQSGFLPLTGYVLPKLFRLRIFREFCYRDVLHRLDRIFCRVNGLEAFSLGGFEQ